MNALLSDPKSASFGWALAAADSRSRCPSLPDWAFGAPRSSQTNPATLCLPWTSRSAGSAAFAPQRSRDPERPVGSAVFGDRSKRPRAEPGPSPVDFPLSPCEEPDSRAWKTIFHNYATAARSKSYLNTLGTLELSTLVTGLLPRLRTEGDPALCVEAPADSSEPADSQALPTEPRPREPPREPLRLFL